MNLQSYLGKSLIQDGESKIANPRWRTLDGRQKCVKMLKPVFYLILMGKESSGITDHEFANLFKQTINPRWRIQDGEFKMVDSRWSAKMVKC